MATKIKLIADDAINATHLDSSASPQFTNLTLTGNLTVQGTTTTLDTTNLQVTDKNIVLNYGTGDTSSGVDGAGITIQDAVDASNDATLNWSAANDRFVMSHGLQVTSGNVGIGTSSPNTRLTVGSGSGTEVLTILAGTSGESQLRFADGTSGTAAYQGRVEYDHANSLLNLGAGGGTQVTINASGNLGLGTSGPSAKCHLYT